MYGLGHFLQKSPIIRGSFAERDLQFKASYAPSPPCTSLGSRIRLPNGYIFDKILSDENSRSASHQLYMKPILKSQLYRYFYRKIEQ